MNLKYRPDIDGLRAFAILSVIIFHLNPNWLRGGFLGVDIFFVISGYLITKIIYSDIIDKKFSFKHFYHRRINRILPVFFFVIFATSVSAWFILYPDEFTLFFKSIKTTTYFWENMFFAKNTGGYFDLSAEDMPILHTWSLAVEEQFYIVFPILLLFLLKIQNHYKSLVTKKTIIIILIGISSVSFLLAQFSYKSLFLIQYNYYSLFTGRAGELLIGSVTGILSLKEYNLSKNKLLIKNIISLIGFVMICFSVFYISKNEIFPSFWALIPTVGTALLIFSHGNGVILTKILSFKFFIFIGSISYSLYLWHWPIIVLAKRLFSIEQFEKIEEYIIVLLLIIMASIFSYFFIEQPCRKNKKNFRFSFAAYYLIPSLFILSIYEINHKINFLDKNYYTAKTIKSNMWFEGKENFLFLGNYYDKTLDKLTLSIKPRPTQINKLESIFNKITDAAILYNTKIALIVGANKSTIYPEYLPDDVTPSKIRYIDFYLNELKKNKNLIVYDPKSNLLENKNSLLYYRTDTHWNNRGAFIAFSGFLKMLYLHNLDVKFKNVSSKNGDLINISGLKQFKLHNDDNFEAIIPNSHLIKCVKIETKQYNPAFGSTEECDNPQGVNNKYVWVIGDSFSDALRKYFNSTFTKVVYLGHWDKRLITLDQDLLDANVKPDMIVIIRVERSF